MTQEKTFTKTIERKKLRLEELAKQPSGERFLHHTVMGVPDRIRSSIPYRIVQYGLMYGKEREANPETNLDIDSFYSDEGGVYVLDDSFDSYREGSDTTQMMTLILDPNILSAEQKEWLQKERKYWGTSPYNGELCISRPISSEHILGAIVPAEGHNVLYDFQTKPMKDIEKLERGDKDRYEFFDPKSKKGTIMETDEEGWIKGIKSFYRGILWGMKDFPQNAFPVFSGFSSTHFPYMSGVRNFFTGEVNEKNEIPLEYYLSQQVFPLTSQAYIKHIFVDMARKRGMTARQIGIAQREARKKLNSEYDARRKEITREMSLNSQETGCFRGVDVYEKRRLILKV